MKRQHVDADSDELSEANTVSSASKRHSLPRLRDHVDGDWPAILYVEVSEHLASELHDRASRTFNRIIDNNSFSASGENLQTIACIEAAPVAEEAPPHISLSRPFALRSHQIDTFVKSLTSAVKLHTRFVVSVSNASEDTLILSGDDSTTKQYLASIVKDNGTQSLGKLMSTIDEIMNKFGKPTYFPDPIYHISLSYWTCEEAKRPWFKSLHLKKLSELTTSDPLPARSQQYKEGERLSDHLNQDTKCSTVATDGYDGNDSESDDIDFRRHKIIISEETDAAFVCADNGLVNKDLDKIYKLPILKVTCKIGNKLYDIELM